MKTGDLLLSTLSITEDEYYYKGSFFLSWDNTSTKVDLADLQNNTKIEELKGIFGLEESTEEIRKTLMDMVLEKAQISSKYSEGENYGQKTSDSLPTE